MSDSFVTWIVTARFGEHQVAIDYYNYYEKVAFEFEQVNLNVNTLILFVFSGLKVVWYFIFDQVAAIS